MKIRCPLPCDMIRHFEGSYYGVGRSLDFMSLTTTFLPMSILNNSLLLIKTRYKRRRHVTSSNLDRILKVSDYISNVFHYGYFIESFTFSRYFFIHLNKYKILKWNIFTMCITTNLTNCKYYSLFNKSSVIHPRPNKRIMSHSHFRMSYRTKDDNSDSVYIYRKVFSYPQDLRSVSFFSFHFVLLFNRTSVDKFFTFILRMYNVITIY